MTAISILVFFTLSPLLFSVYDYMWNSPQKQPGVLLFAVGIPHFPKYNKNGKIKFDLCMGDGV